MENSVDCERTCLFKVPDLDLHCLHRLWQLNTDISTRNVTCLFQLTVADIALYNVFDSRLMEAPYALDPYPRLKANRKATESHPRIAAYLKNRKRTDL